MISKSTDQSENTSDFVSPDVNECLEQARKVITHGTVDPIPNKRILQESTSVKFGRDKRDKIEVVIRRSSVSQQDMDKQSEEPASYSDSELLHYGASTRNLRRTGSQLSQRHTNAKYKRRHGEYWRKADLPTTCELTDDEAEIEVDVKEEECLTDSGSHIVTKSWEARWTAQNYEHLPDWLQDNEYLRHCHRPPLPSYVACFKSIWTLHTETGNIWTHLIGCVAFFCLAIWYIQRSDSHIRLQEKIVFSFFFIGAIICMGLSFTFHTFLCHSFTVSKLFNKLDYIGIALLIIGSFIPFVYYGFYCRPESMLTYIAMISILGIATIIVSLWDKFSEPRYRTLRAVVFVSMGMSGLIPASHLIYSNGMSRLIDENAFVWILAMAFLNLFGAFLYATRTPERFFPGKCDVMFHSHQLFHVCVVCAAFAHYYGISEMAMSRLTSPCPSPIDSMIDSLAKHSELLPQPIESLMDSLVKHSEL